MPDRCRRWIVIGRVQGVSFRAAARTTARSLGLSGFARNRADGSVEVVACGPEAQLDRFADFLAEGPPHARVEDVRVAAAEHRVFRDFDVR